MCEICVRSTWKSRERYLRLAAIEAELGRPTRHRMYIWRAYGFTWGESIKKAKDNDALPSP